MKGWNLIVDYLRFPWMVTNPVWYDYSIPYSASNWYNPIHKCLVIDVFVPFNVRLDSSIHFLA